MRALQASAYRQCCPLFGAFEPEGACRRTDVPDSAAVDCSSLGLPLLGIVTLENSVRSVSRRKLRPRFR